MDKELKDEKQKWYIIHTYSGHEKKVKSALEQRVEALGIDDKVTEVMIPTQEKVVINEGKKRTVEERLFPGYVLVKMEVTDETWPVVKNTSGVTGFVGVEGKPTPLSKEEYTSIVKYSEQEAPRMEVKFQVGDAVKILDGPFKDMIGKVESIDEEKGKLDVLVNIFGRETPVELDFLQVGRL